ncbi:hypothetical protein ACIPSA_47465 [Streptomyces sp. NPDC086549]|uniref:hypothetical protein n=1 Tax=Streptomyces sp. NPDC086549 TaxID=3365752 RepID=UPI00381731F8
MTQTSDREATATVTACPDPGAAVLYVCAERGTFAPDLAAERAETEGRTLAEARGLHLTEVITDPYGEPDPLHREGWVRVRELAESGTVAAVIVRWPAAIAPDSAHELRHREISWLQDRGVRVRYSWEPLASGSGEVK